MFAVIQWNLRIKDTLGAELLSSFSGIKDTLGAELLSFFSEVVLWWEVHSNY